VSLESPKSEAEKLRRGAVDRDAALVPIVQVRGSITGLASHWRLAGERKQGEQ
jgi:alkylhydroperoxidase family enzyme